MRPKNGRFMRCPIGANSPPPQFPRDLWLREIEGPVSLNGPEAVPLLDSSGLVRWSAFLGLRRASSSRPAARRRLRHDARRRRRRHQCCKQCQFRNTTPTTNTPGRDHYWTSPQCNVDSTDITTCVTNNSKRTAAIVTLAAADGKHAKDDGGAINEQ